jgi:alanine racemase
MNRVREKAGGAALVCAPVKADAYGHGAVPVARAAVEAGAACLAVAAVEEGAELRQAGINAPILLLSTPLPEDLPAAADLGLSLVLGDGEMIKAADQAALRTGTTLAVHLKIDTGMGRVGCRPEEAAALAASIAQARSLAYAGTATHFAAADSRAPRDLRYTKNQITLFSQALQSIKDAGLDPGLVHAANSGALLLHEEARFDMVRPGILLYGYAPVKDPGITVEPVMELLTSVSLIKPIRAGEPVSYGGTWTAREDGRIAVLPIGYGDGLRRSLSGRLTVLIRGRFYPSAGRICMDQCMVDLGADSDVRRWDQAVVFGGASHSAAHIAAMQHTIPYEVTCAIGKRVPRIYTR